MPTTSKDAPDRTPDCESRQAYLADDDVKSFVAYLRQFLGDDATFRHKWRSQRDKAESTAGTDGEPPTVPISWQCDGFVDAARQYQFSVDRSFHYLFAKPPSGNLVSHGTVLRSLEKRLRSDSNDTDILLAAIETQVWGGTERNIGGIFAANRRFGTFAKYLLQCEEAFGQGSSFDRKTFQKSDMRSNAGFTKIYALRFDDFVIYDSRVAAALGMFIVRWCLQQEDRAAVPDNLKLSWMPGHSAKSLRNPTFDKYVFSKFNSGAAAHHVQHIWSNIRANWILSAAIKGTAFESRVTSDKRRSFSATPLRALEAALFMIGYDLAGNHPYPPPAPRGTGRATKR